ncbi:MAG: hypothetical protein ABSA11_09505 [Candidatus Bathyarchaeia archaeon]|jgi:hypothetical protein
MKYVYLWFVKMTEEATKKYLVDVKYFPNWTTKAKEIINKYKMKIVVWGTPYYTVEQIVIGVETDASLEDFGKVAMELYHIDPAFVDYAKTLIVTQ